jgi:hypothetical protein
VPTLATIVIVARHVLIQRIYGDQAVAPSPPVTDGAPPGASA